MSIFSKPALRTPGILNNGRFAPMGKVVEFIYREPGGRAEKERIHLGVGQVISVEPVNMSSAEITHEYNERIRLALLGRDGQNPWAVIINEARKGLF